MQDKTCWRVQLELQFLLPEQAVNPVSSENSWKNKWLKYNKLEEIPIFDRIIFRLIQLQLSQSNDQYKERRVMYM